MSYVFADISANHANNVVILTGVEECFMAGARFADSAALTSSIGVNTLYWEGRQLRLNRLNIEIPAIAAVNGPVVIHSDLFTHL